MNKYFQTSVCMFPCVPLARECQTAKHTVQVEGTIQSYDLLGATNRIVLPPDRKIISGFKMI